MLCAFDPQVEVGFSHIFTHQKWVLDPRHRLRIDFLGIMSPINKSLFRLNLMATDLTSCVTDLPVLNLLNSHMLRDLVK